MGNITEAVNTCRDLESGVFGGAMNMNCKGVWHATVDGLPSHAYAMMANNASGHKGDHPRHIVMGEMEHDKTEHHMGNVDSPAYPINSKGAFWWTPWILFHLFVFY